MRQGSRPDEPRSAQKFSSSHLCATLSRFTDFFQFRQQFSPQTKPISPVILLYRGFAARSDCTDAHPPLRPRNHLHNITNSHRSNRQFNRPAPAQPHEQQPRDRPHSRFHERHLFRPPFSALALSHACPVPRVALPRRRTNTAPFCAQSHSLSAQAFTVQRHILCLPVPHRNAPPPPHSPRPIRHNSVGVVRVCFPHRRQHYFGFHSAPCRPAISTAKRKTHDKCTCNKWRRGNAKTRFVYYCRLASNR